MTTTTFILLLYVLPMIIAGLIHYSDKDVKTLGDFMEYWNVIFLPFFNMFCVIVFPFYKLVFYLEKTNWLQRIKDIKIKSAIIFFCSFLSLSCGSKLVTEPIEKYKGKGIVVISTPDENYFYDNEIRCKTKDSIFWIKLTHYDAVNLKVGDTL